MEPAYIYCKELVADKENIFTANIAEKNEVENVKFSKFYTYGVTGMAINPDSNTYSLIKVSDKDKLKEISKKNQNLIKQNKAYSTDLKISNPETKDLLIPLTKKNRTELPPIKLSYFNVSTGKNEEISFCDYYTHLEKFGFEWENDKLEVKYRVELVGDNKFLKKSVTMSRSARCKLLVNESRIWNMDVANKTKKRLSYSAGFFYEEKHVLDFLT